MKRAPLLEKMHHYGEHFHLLDDVSTEVILSRFCSPQFKQPEISHFVRRMSEALVSAVVQCLFPRSSEVVETRMAKDFPAQAKFRADLVDPQSRVVIVDLMRAGILPTQTAFEFLHDVLPAENLRQDHIMINRVVDQNQQVIGAHVGGHKIGGPIEDAFVLFPDPMGATGSSISQVIEIYKGLKLGRPKKFVAMHFIVTPEYLKKTLPLKEELEIFALRVDRGMSPSEILGSPLGKFWGQERGLNDKQYIVPGAGGIGEILNNSFV